MGAADGAASDDRIGCVGDLYSVWDAGRLALAPHPAMHVMMKEITHRSSPDPSLHLRDCSCLTAQSRPSRPLLDARAGQAQVRSELHTCRSSRAPHEVLESAGRLGQRLCLRPMAPKESNMCFRQPEEPAARGSSAGDPGRLLVSVLQVICVKRPASAEAQHQPPRQAQWGIAMSSHRNQLTGCRSEQARLRCPTYRRHLIWLE